MLVPFDFADASVFLAPVFAGRRRRVAASTVAFDRHLLDIGQERDLRKYSIDATISDDVPPTVNVYVAPTRDRRVERDQVLRRYPDAGRWLHQAGSYTSGRSVPVS